MDVWHCHDKIIINLLGRYDVIFSKINTSKSYTGPCNTLTYYEIGQYTTLTIKNTKLCREKPK